MLVRVLFLKLPCPTVRPSAHARAYAHAFRVGLVGLNFVPQTRTDYDCVSTVFQKIAHYFPVSHMAGYGQTSALAEKRQLKSNLHCAWGFRLFLNTSNATATTATITTTAMMTRMVVSIGEDVSCSFSIVTLIQPSLLETPVSTTASIR